MTVTHLTVIDDSTNTVNLAMTVTHLAVIDDLTNTVNLAHDGLTHLAVIDDLTNTGNLSNMMAHQPNMVSRTALPL